MIAFDFDANSIFYFLNTLRVALNICDINETRGDVLEMENFGGTFLTVQEP